MTAGFYSFIESYIDLPYLVMFVSLTYGLKDVICAVASGLLRTTVQTKYAVFFFATLLAVPFWFFTDPMKLAVTYAVGTSFYELIIQGIETAVRKYVKNKRNG